MSEGRPVVIVADDDVTLRRTTAELLEDAGTKLVRPQTASRCWRSARSAADLIALDIMMPKMDGFETLAHLRETDRVTPVLFLSARGDIVDKRTGFRLGADDYLVKPFLAEELLLRVEAMLRRVDALGEALAPAAPTSVTLGSLTVDLRHGEVTAGDRRVDLTPKERRIMCVLAESPGRAFTRDELIGAVWGEEYVDSSISIPVYVRNLREKIEAIRRIPSTCRRCGAMATGWVGRMDGRPRVSPSCFRGSGPGRHRGCRRCGGSTGVADGEQRRGHHVDDDKAGPCPGVVQREPTAHRRAQGERRQAVRQKPAMRTG